MDNLLYSLLNSYFIALSNFGYVEYNKVYDLIYLTAVQDLTRSDYDGFLSEEDYTTIQKALYKLFGTSCMLTSPKQDSLDTIYLDSSSRLATETEKLKDVVDDIKRTTVVKTKDTSSTIEIDDIIL